MRLRIAVCLIFAVAASLPAVSQAQPPRERLTIERVRVGLPEGRNSDQGKYKTGMWAPVYVDLTTGPEDLATGEAVLIVETADNDGIQNRYTRPLPALPKKQTITGLITYVRPGNYSSEVNVAVEINQRQVARAKSTPDANAIVDNGGALWLTLGSKLPGLQRALMVRQNQPDQFADENVPDDDLMDSPLRRFAAIDQLEQMPTRWFGYQAVDVLVLTTSNESFVKGLATDRTGRLDALTEWVRRGGRMVISTAHNQQFVGNLLAEMRLMDCKLGGTVMRPLLIGFQSVLSRPARFPTQGEVEIAKIKLGVGVGLLEDKLLEAPDKRDVEARPLAVQAGCGLGHVILIGCDLDAPPFTAWKGQGDFWRYLQSKVEPHLGNAGRQPTGLDWDGNDNNQLASQLENSLEKFGNITVISFGWVALFILLYIIVIGPLDYLFLKKVVKRLELTWITFPAIVVVISAAAYFTAYYLKGNDLKINKLDLVDIDLTPAVDERKPPPRIYGSTWFTLFSPRIQHYTIGLEAADGWGGPADASTLIGWMGRPDNGYGGTGRAGSQSLFRRTYDFAPDASGLIGVPIQVWATKSFTASWVVPASTAAPPFSAAIKHPPAAPESIIGTITNNLPVDLADVDLFYKGTVYPQGRLDAGAMKRIDLTSRKNTVEWLSASYAAPPRPGALGDDLASWSTRPSMRSLLFHDRTSGNQGGQNTGLRFLDQGWRLKDYDEVVLVGRVDPRGGDGPAEKVTFDSGSPSRLWLGELPTAGRVRPRLEGTLTQRTFVRVYIPVLNSRQ